MRATIRATFIAAAVLALSINTSLRAAGAELPADSRIALNQDDRTGQLRVVIDGKEAFVYCYGKDLDLPHFFPVRSPAGQSMTVEHPNPYPHHRSFWFADKVALEGKRAMSVYSAWCTGSGGRANPKPPFADHVRHVEFIPAKTAGDRAEIAMKLVWEMDHNVPVLDELRKIRVVALGDGEYFLDITFTVTAAYGPVTFRSDAVHYAWPYIRMNSQFSVDGGGTITNSAGGVNQKQTNGQVAEWIDYSNTVEGQSGGLAIFSHPDNPRPHKWLTRDYGCFGPRRVAERSGKPFTLARSGSLSRRVGVLVHRGDVKAGRVAERFGQYADGKL